MPSKEIAMALSTFSGECILSTQIREHDKSGKLF
jgi:hypothetical protein